MDEFTKQIIDFFKSIPGKLLEAIGIEIENGLLTEIWNIVIKLLPYLIALIILIIIVNIIRKHSKKQKLK